MTLSDVKQLLSTNGWAFSEISLGYSEIHNRIALVIPSNNGMKNIELVFVDQSDYNDFVFFDLQFGDFFFELFDNDESELPQLLTDHIVKIISNCLTVVQVSTPKFKYFRYMAVYDKSETGKFGLQGLHAMLSRINKKESWFHKFSFRKKKYEIYDYNDYQCIIK